jgi:N-carbamoyl-L-amino-acid hydrolase
VELHIEQGGTLERDGVPVGVVDGIVAIDRYDIIISGFANHAGTTPMQDRQDALVAASMLTLAVRETVTGEAGAQVGTVGHLNVSPNAANVIPGEVKMSFELRDLSSAKLERLAERIRARSRAIAADTRTEIQMGQAAHNESATAAAEVQHAIESAASKLRLNTRHLPSGAGHDAQMMATLMPMGMIFVPSVDGISHSPRELSRFEDCAQGADVLLGTILELDRIDRVAS